MLKLYLINHLIPTMLSGRCFVFLFHQGTEQPHQGNMNTRGAIHHTTKEVRYRIKLDLEGLPLLSFGRADGVDGRESYHMVVEHLVGRKSETNGEICVLKYCGVAWS
jgi:hypothetical protein